ncbi:hypothetical protein GGR50DRAFT_697298 [Xylaria sp. CBS 124048]|nr:hypothetical protein GGR50DRAFT_697298 [Xylaria sp. CBS 124048]
MVLSPEIPERAWWLTDRKHWGSDPLTWRPPQWIKAGDGEANATSPGVEDLISSDTGQFLAGLKMLYPEKSPLVWRKR